jgi:aspartate/methionine/tyrosine aminotransferase
VTLTLTRGSARHIITTATPAPARQVALQTAAFALAAGCHSIVFTPGYQSTVEAPLHAGGRVTALALRAEDGWQIDPRGMATLAS